MLLLVADVDDATALAVGANVIGLLAKDPDTALDAIERALSLNPSSAAALFFGAHVYAWSGDPDVAAGEMFLTPEDGVIRKLVVTFDRGVTWS